MSEFTIVDYPFRMACCGSIGKIEDVHTLAELDHYICHHMNCYESFYDIQNGTPFALNQKIIKEAIEKFKIAHPELNYEYPSYLEEYLKPVKIIEEKKCCGNCKWWTGRETNENSKFCEAPLPDSILDDNLGSMNKDAGKNCESYKRKN